MLIRGLQAVDLIDHGGCIACGREPNLGDICWFNLPDELQDHPPAQV